MNDTTWQRLFGFRHAFDHPVTVVVTLTAVVLLVLAPLLIFITTRAAKSTAEKRKELWDRYRSCRFRRWGAAAHFLRGVMPVEPWQLQPARDTGLTPAERFRSVRRESGLLESVAQQACFSVLRIYFSIAHRLTISGREKLPAHGPFVLAANHCSHLDALVLGCSAQAASSRTRFPDRCWRRLLSNHCSQCVLRNHAQRFADVAKKLWSACSCRVASQIAGRKSDFHHLPGRRTHAHRFNDAFQARTRDAGRGNKCSGRALRSYWNFEALPPNRKVPRPVRIKLIIGEPLNFAATPNNREGWSQIARSLESSVRELAINKAKWWDIALRDRHLGRAGSSHSSYLPDRSAYRSSFCARSGGTCATIRASLPSYRSSRT